MDYIPKYLPPKEHTLEDLKAIGFTCHNIVQVKYPRIAFNKSTIEVLDSPFGVPEGFEEKLMITRRIFPDADVTPSILKEYNSKKLIAWLPNNQPVGDIAHHIRLAVLID